MRTGSLPKLGDRGLFFGCIDCLRANGMVGDSRSQTTGTAQLSIGMTTNVNKKINKTLRWVLLMVILDVLMSHKPDKGYFIFLKGSRYSF